MTRLKYVGLYHLNAVYLCRTTWFPVWIQNCVSHVPKGEPKGHFRERAGEEAKEGLQNQWSVC